MLVLQLEYAEALGRAMEAPLGVPPAGCAPHTATATHALTWEALAPPGAVVQATAERAVQTVQAEQAEQAAAEQAAADERLLTRLLSGWRAYSKWLHDISGCFAHTHSTACGQHLVCVIAVQVRCCSSGAPNLQCGDLQSIEPADSP